MKNNGDAKKWKCLLYYIVFSLELRIIYAALDSVRIACFNEIGPAWFARCTDYLIVDTIELIEYVIMIV